MALTAQIHPAAATGPRPLDAGAINIPTEPQTYSLRSFLLNTGNILVTDSGYDTGTDNPGAVFLYDGATGALISKLTGTSFEGPQEAQVTLLSNANFVINSTQWKLDGVTSGAVTWGSGTAGVTGVVSITNSLVGLQNARIYTLTNGNFVVGDQYQWSNRGIYVWVDGTQGITGVVTESMGLVGSAEESKVIALSNGNYVVTAPRWDNGPATDAGAVTWANGAVGITGEVSVANSLVGAQSDDKVGSAFNALPNGNYVVRSPFWDLSLMSDAGAVTWADGAVGITGEVSITNSLVGGASGDSVGEGAYLLTNGNVLVSTPAWDNGPTTNAGAMTWMDAAVGITGVVTTTNSLVGARPYDRVGSYGVTTLTTDGNYVVWSPAWHDGSMYFASESSVGAFTWGSGTSGVTGVVTTTNSLVGTSNNDFQGAFVVKLTNGNYVVSAKQWKGVGAVTWGDGSVGVTGAVSTSNSLVGELNYDRVGTGVFPLANGNYVVVSPLDGDAGYGAVTWADGSKPTSGTVNASNSLVGGNEQDYIGSDDNGDLYMLALANGNYVVGSPNWGNGIDANVGAVTLVDGSKQVTGTISVTNSIVGDREDDHYGERLIALGDSRYLAGSSMWHRGNPEAGALTWGDGVNAITGVADASNSIVGISNINDVQTTSAGGYAIVRRAQWNGPRDAFADTGAVLWNPLGTATTGWVTSTHNAILGVSDLAVAREGYQLLPNGDMLVYGAPRTVSSTYSMLWLPHDEIVTGSVDTLSGYSAYNLTSEAFDGFNARAQISATTNGEFTLFTNWAQDRHHRILRRLRSDASLSALEVSIEGLTPSFVSTTLSYSATASVTTTSVTLTPTLSDPANAVTVTNASGPCTDNTCALVDGWNAITMVVLAEDWTPRNYVVHVLRPTTDASLSDLALSAGTLVPSFVSSTTNYAASVPNAEASLIVTPTTNNAAATFIVSNAAGDCTSNTCPLDVGANTLSVTVTASDGTTTQTYVLVVTRAEAPTPTETPEPSVTPTPAETPTPTEPPPPAAPEPYVSPRYGAVTTSTLRIIGPVGSGFTGATGVYVNRVKQFHIVISDRRINFVMKPGVAGATVDVVLIKADGEPITITRAYTFEAPTSVVLDASTGGVLTTTSGVTITMPSQSALRPSAPAIGASMVVTYAPVEQPAEPPGDVPLSFFNVSVSIDDSPITTLINPATLELPVDPMMVPADQVARLYEWVAASSWSPVPGQSYDSAAGLVTAPIQRLGTYALVTVPANQWWFPVVTLK